MAKSNTVLGNTKKSLNLEEISVDSISVLPVKDTQILEVKVIDDAKAPFLNYSNKNFYKIYKINMEIKYNITYNCVKSLIGQT